MTIESLFVFGSLFLLGYALWQHANVSRNARNAAISATEKYGVVLLDQSVILKKIRLRRSTRSGLAIERRYGFEFSSTGNQRYSGTLVFEGAYLRTIDMDAYQV